MQDLLLERTKRLHGDFLDPDGEYDLVSSLSGGFANGVLSNNDEDASPLGGREDYYNHNQTDDSQGLFCAQLTCVVLMMVTIFWYFYHWIIRYSYASDSKNKTTAATGGVGRSGSSTTTSVTVSTSTTTLESNTTPLAVGETEALQDDKYEAQTSSPSRSQRGQPPSKGSATLNESRQQVSLFQEDMFVCYSSTTSSRSVHHKRRKRRRPPSDSVSSSAFDDPPSLIAELHQQEYISRRFLSQSCTTTPVQSTRTERTRSSFSLPTTPSTAMFQGVNDSSFHSCSELEATQHLAQVFCQKVQVIEEVLAQSGMNSVDRSRAVELALMQQQHEHEQSMRQHNAATNCSLKEGYLKARVPLQKARDDCFQATWAAVYHSFWVAVIMEGGRHAVNLVTALDYFSIHELGWTIVQTGCGCYEPAVASYYWQGEQQLVHIKEGGHQESLFSYALSQVSSVVMVASSAAASTKHSIETLIRLTGYVSCFLCYVLVLGCIALLHAVMQHLRCPACLHQLVNGGILLAFVAQNPLTWLVVTQNLALYARWILVQIVLTLTSIIWVEIHYRRARAQILGIELRKKKVREASGPPIQDVQDKINQLVVTRVAELENVRWVIGIVPPILLVLLAIASSLLDIAI